MSARMDMRALRSAFGRFATGVTIVTALGPDGRPIGMTANSFSSVSLDPPLVSWCLGLRSSLCAAFRAAPYFAINVLSEMQADLSARFAAPLPDRFAGVDWTSGLGGAPLIEDCIARFECAQALHFEAGDHAVLVGKVEAFTHCDGAPLIFFSGRYGIGRAEAATPAQRGP